MKRFVTRYGTRALVAVLALVLAGTDWLRPAQLGPLLAPQY